ncbi:MAG TPA: biosynthetic-type acetolactate synthase large subunit [Elusimicrobiota bacterium]|nr:biosynthetic-type acetolactate synthase large subunit [Elusimicrobiota bacterium]
MELTGAQIVVGSLVREGVKVAFGIPGGQALPLYDALYDAPFRLVLTRHEQGASHMADGYARASGKVGVCFATSGPGATNLITGLANAYMDSIPVVAITGQVRTGVIGSDAFQEADATGCTRSVTKHNFLVKDVRDLARIIREAFHIAATGRPGPVHIDVPVDVQRAKTPFVWPATVRIRSYRPISAPSDDDVRRAAELIRRAQRPLLYVGGGVISSGASDALRRVAEKTDTPVANTLMANGAIPFDHPLALGPLGMHGKYVSNMALQHCDLLISCGARFDDRVTGDLKKFSPKSKKIHFDIDPACINKNVPVDVGVLGDVRRSLEKLLPLVSRKSHPVWRREIKAWDKKHPLSYRLGDGLVKPQHVIKTLHRLTRGEALVVTGVGQHQMWSMQWYQAKRPRHFLSSGGLGTMGFGFPAAIGAKLARPDRTVVSIEGDGSFQMTMTEMAIAVREHIPIVVILLNNYYLGMVRQWQQLFYNKRFSSTALTVKGANAADGKEPTPGRDPYVPDFMKWAAAYGIEGYRLTRNEQVEGALRKALAAKSPVLVEAIIPRDENVFPMIPAGMGVENIIVDMA